MSIGVLLADDQSMVRTGFRMILESDPDISVVGESANGEQALDATRRLRPDVVLMDIQMPEMDGLEATRRIHQRWGQGRHPHIVAMTANAMEGDREMCIAAGMNDYVSKPIRVNELVEALLKAERK